MVESLKRYSVKTQSNFMSSTCLRVMDESSRLKAMLTMCFLS